MNDAAGPIVHLSLSAGLADEVDADSVITALARERHLVCFDPDEPQLLQHRSPGRSTRTGPPRSQWRRNLAFGATRGRTPRNLALPLG